MLMVLSCIIVISSHQSVVGVEARNPLVPAGSARACAARRRITRCSLVQRDERARCTAATVTSPECHRVPVAKGGTTRWVAGCARRRLQRCVPGGCSDAELHSALSEGVCQAGCPASAHFITVATAALLIHGSTRAQVMHAMHQATAQQVAQPAIAWRSSLWRRSQVHRRRLARAAPSAVRQRPLQFLMAG